MAWPKKTAKNREFKRKQFELFETIWAERPHVCSISGDPLGDQLNPWFFAHILGKGAYSNPLMSLNPENIALMTPDMHFKYDHQGVEGDSRFDWLLEKKQELKEWYYHNPDIK